MEDLWNTFKTWFYAAPIIGVAIWGAMGGMTNALVIRVTFKEAIRHVILGAIIAAGMGGFGVEILAHYLRLPDELSARAGALGGSGAYLVGSIGAALMEAVLKRIRGVGK